MKKYFLSYVRFTYSAFMASNLKYGTYYAQNFITLPVYFSWPGILR